MTSGKIIDFKDARQKIAALKKKGKKIVQCHGTFDLLHPGHIIHFEEAKVLGDVLVVTVTAEKYVNKGPGRPYFNDMMRLKYLSALECVDYVVLIPYPAAIEAIETIRPDIYCKGKEYQNTDIDVTGNIHNDLAAVKRVGGQIKYVGSVVFSSTKLLNNHFEIHPPEMKEFCRTLSAKYKPADFLSMVEGFSKLKVLVIGDIIFDHYSTVKVQGLTSKNRIISTRMLGQEVQAGGALAAFRHIKQFTPRVKLLSLVGTENWVNPTLSDYISKEEDAIIRKKDFTTIVKQRFVEPLSEGKDLSKLFSVNLIDGDHPGPQVQEKVCDVIAKEIKKYDLVMVMDFGHGLMGDMVREFVQEKAGFLALNCQTNSNNHGFNIIDRQYHNADSFSLDETEITLAAGRRDIDFMIELDKLRSKLGSSYAWLTRGATDTIGLKSDKSKCMCAPFERVVIDTVGAGDAFCSVTSLAAVKGLPIDMATFMGQLAGAQAVRIVGNSESIKKDKLLKGGMALLSH